MTVLYGVPVSLYVRKVMLAHAHKGVNYELAPTRPGSDEPDFVAASPLKKIPAYTTDKGTSFSDSTVIVAYLEKTSPQNSLYPENAELYAKALWLEEYTDTKLAEVVTGLYYQRIIGPRVFNVETDSTRVNELIQTLIPQELAYIESQLVANEWTFDNTFSIADLGIGINLVSLRHADYHIDESQLPKLSEFNKRFMALDIVAQQIAQEEAVFASFAEQ